MAGEGVAGAEFGKPNDVITFIAEGADLRFLHSITALSMRQLNLRRAFPGEHLRRAGDRRWQHPVELGRVGGAEQAGAEYQDMAAGTSAAAGERRGVPKDRRDGDCSCS